uniref:Uncharacterized mitochondrial protein AtMg00860-like n=1 Tax=Nicotiana tabacum TaxID=4097 RepID=A0A1S3YCK5_TOBAC|nr:PREDICTED: uncharacterized mitochondrial protein AtMg00860-like [Nicotiana tabacum]
MKLNPEKCAFRVSSGKFLGFLMSQKGNEVNPDKIKAIKDIPDQLSSVKEIQRLIGRLAALSRFISQYSKKCHHFSLLKKKNNFEWSPECQQDLKDLKMYLSSPPLLSKSEEGKQLPIYLVVSNSAWDCCLWYQSSRNGVRANIKSFEVVHERGFQYERVRAHLSAGHALGGNPKAGYKNRSSH